jgi:hypothetical protein
MRSLLVAMLCWGGCSFEETGVPVQTSDAKAAVDDASDADARKAADARAHADAQIFDARWPDAPPDAFVCTSNEQCSTMKPGDCCVTPGPTGYCTRGIVIATVCMPQ